MPPADDSFSYDVVPYNSLPYPDTHPGRLFAVATLFGLAPPPVETARVLELGCASGNNLLPMAESLPRATFVGLDLSARQIADGHETVRAAGLANIELRHASILDVDAGWGEFDYVLAHGIYSWVPPAVRDKVLEICGTRTTPNGVGYVSYNVLPGWRLKGVVRDLMRYHAAPFPDPAKRVEQARAVLEFMMKATTAQEGSAYAVMLRAELDFLRRAAPSYLYHDLLEEVNEPCYFHEFVDRAAGHGLRYLGEAAVGAMIPENLGPDASAVLKSLGADMVRTEQYMDFVRNRTFRQTLVVRDTLAPKYHVEPAAVRGLHAAGRAKPAAPPDLATARPVAFRSLKGVTLTTDRPLVQAAFLVMSEAWPNTVRFDALLAEARDRVTAAGGTPPAPPDDAAELGAGLVNALFASGFVDLHGAPHESARVVSDRPAATRVARHLAGRMSIVANAQHAALHLDDLERRVFPLLDGTRSPADLIDHLARAALAGEVRVEADGQPVTDPAAVRATLTTDVDRVLAKFAANGLLVA